jgi:hypothetical protein
MQFEAAYPSERPVEMIVAPLLDRNNFDEAKHRDHSACDLDQALPDLQSEPHEVVRANLSAFDRQCSSELESAFSPLALSN